VNLIIYNAWKTRELGLAYADLTDTLERTISWFRAEGLLN
jgi:hypothetical protein